MTARSFVRTVVSANVVLMIGFALALYLFRVAIAAILTVAQP